MDNQTWTDGVIDFKNDAYADTTSSKNSWYSLI